MLLATAPFRGAPFPEPGSTAAERWTKTTDSWKVMLTPDVSTPVYEQVRVSGFSRESSLLEGPGPTPLVIFIGVDKSGVHPKRLRKVLPGLTASARSTRLSRFALGCTLDAERRTGALPPLRPFRGLGNLGVRTEADGSACLIGPFRDPQWISMERKGL